MGFLKEYLTNPIFFFTFTGLGILVGMFIFFGWFFWYKSNQSYNNLENKEKEA